MKPINRLVVGYVVKKDVDFGMLNEDYREGTIKVKEEEWLDYVEKRFAFGIAHENLIEKIPVRKREKLFQEDKRGKNANTS